MTEKTYRYVSIFMAALLVISMSVAFVGIGAADRTADLEDGDRYWLGQVLEYDLGENEENMSNAEVVTDEGDFVTELTVTDDSVSIDTESSDFEAGSYNLTYDYTDTSETEDSDESRTVSFELSNQSLSVDIEDLQVDNEGDDTETELELDSNRNTYDVNVSSDNLSDEDLAQVFSAQVGYDFDEDNVEDGQLTLSEVPSNLATDFTGVDADEYTFAFDVVDTTASDDVTVTVSEPGDATASFVDVATIAEGDIGEITVEFENTNEIEVVVGDDDDVGYELDFTVSDLSEDDGEVTILFNSYLAGQEDTDVVTLHDDSDGTISVGDETGISDPLVPETYDLSLLTDNSETDVSTLNIVERSTNGVSTHVLPQDADVDELEDIEQATPSDVVAEDDYLVVEVEMNGIYSFLDSDYDLEEGSGDYDTYGLYMEIVEAANSPNVNPTPIDISEGDIHTDSSNGVFYVVFDTSSEEFEFDDDAVEYDVEVELDEHNAYIDEEEDTETVEVSFDAEERLTEFVSMNDNDVVEFEEGENITVTAETNVAENTEDTLTVRKTGDNSFVNTYDLTVEDSEFSSYVDGESLSVGDEFTVRINGETDRVDAVIVESTGATDDDEGATDDDDGTTDDDDGATDDDEGATDDDDGTTDDDDGTTDDDTPGFGALVALVALVAAALLAVRRNN